MGGVVWTEVMGSGCDVKHLDCVLGNFNCSLRVFFVKFESYSLDENVDKFQKHCQILICLFIIR